MDMLTTLHTSAHQLGAIPDGTVQAVITSPPYYGLRSYAGEQDIEWPTVTYRLNEWCEPVTVDAWRGPLGLEPSPVAYIGHLILCLREWGRVLRDDGVCFVNLGDSYAGSGGAGGDYNGGGIREGQPRWKSQFRAGATVKPKDLLGIPWMFAFAARADGWYLRSGVTWIKGNPMPESVTDRPTKSTEMVFMLAKSQRYYYDLEATRELSDTLNRVNSREKAAFKVGTNGAAPGSFTGQSGNVSLNDQWTPHLILSSLLTTKRILVKERNDYLRQVFDVFQYPSTRRVCFAILSRLLIMNSPANVLGYVFKHIGIVLSKGDLQSETELRVRLRSIGSAAMEGYDGSFPVEEASEIIAKIVANTQAVRDAVSVNTLPEGVVDVDMVCKSVALLQCSDLDAGHIGDGLITETVLEKFLLAFSKLSSEQGLTVEWHDKSPLAGAFGSNYTTKQPSGANLRDWWYVNTQPYAASHYAVFPERLVEPMVKAATSERGCCAQCGAPWRRVVERERSYDHVTTASGKSKSGPYANQTGDGDGTHDIRHGVYSSSTTIGWEPSCDCDAGEPVPCTILDPFAGSGTTGRVAIRFGRRAILCDVSAEYLVDHVPDRTTVQMELLA